jgi:phytoene/squalene synthetase
MNLYDQTTFGCSRLITQEYSTSFTLGIKTLAPKFRLPVYAVYGFVRYADEIVDTFHGFDKKRLLADFRTDTYRAIDEGISLNPVLHSFQLVVNQYGIDRDLIEAFLHSMEMDLTETTYAPDGYQEYIYGSAEVVGLMCLRIFCEGDAALYNRLKADARKLGAAFQKVNFLRDLKADYDERGRTYFPGVNFNAFTERDKKAIEADIQRDFDDALRGIRQLPRSARLGVYLAYRYYLRLFAKIKALPPSRIREARVRVPDFQKLLLLAQTYCLHQLRAV